MEQASLPLVENEYGGEYAQMSDLEGGRASSRPSLPRPSQGGRRTTMGLSRERVTVSRVTVGRSTRITQHDADLLNRPTTTAGEDMGGLSSEEAARRLEQYGRNEVAEQETSILWMFLKQFLGMMPFAITVCFILAIIATDYIDCLFIGSLLIINAVVGFREEYEAYCALQELIDSDIKTARVKRDGKIYTQIDENTGETIGLPIEMLVPGDVISIKIGDIVPADCKILEGEIKMDTKSITGEPMPWRVPRNSPEEPPNPTSKVKPEGYRKDEKGAELWAGCDVTQGECHAMVIRTGATTWVGEVQAALADKDVGRKSDFEMKILFSVKIIISVAVVISVLMAIIQSTVRGQTYETGLKALVALLIGSVPVALPLVLLVTMAMGSVTMSNEKALVSDLAALQDIASMTCLNSDKTGTLTTAVMDIIIPSIHAEPQFTSDDILEMAAVCSNRANADDAIDGAIIRAFDKTKGGPEQGEQLISSKWKVVSTKGFNNAAKRVECMATNQQGQTIMIVKGLIGKILKNNSNSAADNAENEDNSHTRFECKDYENVKERIEALDVQLACDGYKTIGLGIRRSPDAEVEFAGIVPMLDPPRDDAPLCIQMIREAGVNVKMVTGDHQNIAKTTAGIIGLGTNILPNTAFSECSGAKLNQLVLEADGFAQVMPNDKETVVLEEQAAGWIVGFCGDGMNDALALNAAQVGIAVADAMDAAIKASAIQLLDPGLQCIYTAIVESRKIFRRVKAYVTYRFAATIQVIVFLSVAVFVSGCQIDLIYIVILALLNDLTMMPLSSDNQKASIVPDNPVVWKILAQASTFGLLQAAISIAWFYIANQSDFLDTVKDSHHVEPITWFSYLQSQGGTDGTMAKQYRQCVAQLCPALSCHHKDTGALSVAECSCKDGGVNGWGGLQPHATEDQPCCSHKDAFGRRSIDLASGRKYDIVCPSMGDYSHPQLPAWQECCVEYAGLKHPGQPHYGSTDSVCTEISTVSVFVQILIASEFMIFPVRALSWMWTNRASTALYVSVFLTCFIFSIFAALGVPRDFGPLGDVFSQTLGWRNMGLAWAWSCGATLIIDVVKYNWVLNVDGTTEEIVHERVADRFNTEKAIALDVSRQSTTSTSIRRTEASIQSQRGDSTVTGSTGMRPSTRFSVGNAVVPGRTDPASLGAALARASRQSRLSRRTGGQF